MRRLFYVGFALDAVFFLSTWLGSDLGHREHRDIVSALIRRRHMPRPVFSDGRKAMVLTVDHGSLCGGDELACTIREKRTKADSFCDGNPCYFKPRKSSCCFCFACCYRLLLVLLRSAACCGVSVPQHTSSDLILGIRSIQQQQWPIETYGFFCCFFLRCCSLAASHMALQALHLWHSRCCCSRAVSPLLCDSHGRRLCVRVCVRLCVSTSLCDYTRTQKTIKRAVEDFFFEQAAQSRGDEIGTVCSSSSSNTTAAVPWQPCFKFLPSCQQSRCVCVVGAQKVIEPRQRVHVQ